VKAHLAATAEKVTAKMAMAGSSCLSALRGRFLVRPAAAGAPLRPA
jgi:hypothetical protein